jgi:polyferredoxin
MKSVQNMAAQVFRKSTQLGVGVLIAWTAANLVWRNYRVAHNSERLVELMYGAFVARLYAWNEAVLAVAGDALETSQRFLGMPWALTLAGQSTFDPILALTLSLASPTRAPTFLLLALVPTALAVVAGKVFCSHLCPARFAFEIGQSVRRGLLRLGVPLPEFRSDVRLGPFVLVGGLVGATLGGVGLWFFVLPYLSIAGAIVLTFTGGPALALAGTAAAFVVVDAFVAPGAVCHNLCPTGAVLETLGRFSLLRVMKSRSARCPDSCRVCRDVCPYALSPRDETHEPACNSCAVCVSACPKGLLTREVVLPTRRRSLPVVALALALLPAGAATAHHNKGLPHYGYFENYPQVPTEEYVYIHYPWEIGATVFNFQGLERENASTPNDVKIYMYLYDLKADHSYTGPIDFELLLGGEVVSTFSRDRDDGEATYATRETLPRSGAYTLVARPRNHPGVRVPLDFDVDLAIDRVRWEIIAALLLPVALVMGLAIFGRSRLRRRRTPRTVLASLLLAPLVFAMGLRAETVATTVAPRGEHASHEEHANMDHAGHGAMEHPRATGMDHPHATGMDHPHATGMDHPHATAMDHPHATGMDHSAHEGHTMVHYQTDDGAQVMVMGGIPRWLFLLGAALVVILSFIVVEVFGARKKSTWRFNLAKDKRVYRLLRSRWFQAVPQLAVVVLFMFLTYAGLFGSRTQNITPIAVWTIWWGGLVFAVALIGPAFCFACPWDGLANIASRLRAIARVEPISLSLPFPSWAANLYPAIALFVVLTWLELGFGVTTDPRTTATMGIGMAAFAIVGAMLFDGKRFCHHGCPVGRISGIYANVSPIEIRAKNPKTCTTCKTEDCLNGNERGYPCPTGISLKVIQDSSYCTMCTECIKSCDRQNVAVNLRPFGADLDAPRRGRLDEAWLSVSLLALTLFHGFSMTPAWENHRPGGESLMRLMATTLGTPKEVNFTLGMMAIVALPITLYAISVWLGAKLAGSVVTARELFIQYAYSILPVALFYHLAHNAMHVLMEGGSIVPRLSDPLGQGSDWFGTRDLHMGPLLSEQATWVTQVVLILVGHVIGIVVAHRIAHRLFPDKKSAIQSLVPMLVVMVCLSVAGLGLMSLDMNMRVGRM